MNHIIHFVKHNSAFEGEMQQTFYYNFQKKVKLCIHCVQKKNKRTLKELHNDGYRNVSICPSLLSVAN